MTAAAALHLAADGKIKKIFWNHPVVLVVVVEREEL